MPEYRTAGGTPYYPVAEKTAECPVSTITRDPQTLELLNIFSRAEHAYRAGGASLFGPVLADWPCWAVDALNVIEICGIQENNARVEAEASEMRNR